MSKSVSYKPPESLDECVIILMAAIDTKIQGSPNSRILKDIAMGIAEFVQDFALVHPRYITPYSTFIDDLGMDSLEVIDFSMYAEERFGLKITDELAERFAFADPTGSNTLAEIGFQLYSRMPATGERVLN